MTRRFSDYTLCPDLTETAVQDPVLTESYGNFGLETGWAVRGRPGRWARRHDVAARYQEPEARRGGPAHRDAGRGSGAARTRAAHQPGRDHRLVPDPRGNRSRAESQRDIGRPAHASTCPPFCSLGSWSARCHAGIAADLRGGVSPPGTSRILAVCGVLVTIRARCRERRGEQSMTARNITRTDQASSCYFRTTADGGTRKALVQIDERCNLHCAHCFVSATRTGQSMPYDGITSLLIPSLNACRVERVTLTGGEPTIHPHFIEIVRALRGAGMQVGFCTN